MFVCTSSRSTFAKDRTVERWFPVSGFWLVDKSSQNNGQQDGGNDEFSGVHVELHCCVSKSVNQYMLKYNKQSVIFHL